MSWTFALHQINRSFDQIARWYQEFMHRTETSFQALHERIRYLEQRQALQDDEQIERVLRKILAEKFGDTIAIPPSGMRNGTFVMNRPDDPLAPRPVELNIASLVVDPESVPSRTYQENFKMLENKLRGFPETDVNGNDIEDRNDDHEFKRPTVPNHIS